MAPRKPHLNPGFRAAIDALGARPRAAADPDALRKERPVWRLGRVDLDGPWGWRGASPSDLLRLLDRMRSFESMTWEEVERSPSCGGIEAAELCGDAQKRLVEVCRDDVDVLYKLRVTKAGRLWGVRIGTVFEILWWDPEHSVYPMNIKDN